MDNYFTYCDSECSPVASSVCSAVSLACSWTYTNMFHSYTDDNNYYRLTTHKSVSLINKYCFVVNVNTCKHHNCSHYLVELITIWDLNLV